MCLLEPGGLTVVFSIHARFETLRFFSSDTSSISKQPLQMFFCVRYPRDTFGKLNNRHPVFPKKSVCGLPLKRQNKAASPPTYIHAALQTMRCLPTSAPSPREAFPPSERVQMGQTNPRLQTMLVLTGAFHSYFSVSGEVDPQILIWLCPLPCYSNKTVSKTAQPFPEELSR